MGFSTKAKREQKNKEGWKKALTIRKSSAQKTKNKSTSENMVQEKKKKNNKTKPEPAKNPKDAHVTESISEFDIRIHLLPYFSFLLFIIFFLGGHTYITLKSK